MTMNINEFKKYMVEYLEADTIQDITVRVSNEINPDDSLYYFIKYLSIGDSEIIVYGSYGGHSCLINLDDFDELEESEKILEYFAHCGEFSLFEVTRGISGE